VTISRKPHAILILTSIVLVAATLACGAPRAAPTEAPIEIPATPTTDALPPAPTPETPIATEPTQGGTLDVGAAGGFTMGTIVDAATLPILETPATGIGPIICDEPHSEPAIGLRQITDTSFMLCLYHWPFTTGDPSLRVTMTDPGGGTYTNEFMFGAIDTGVLVADTRGNSAGMVTLEGNEFGAPPSVGLQLFFEAPLPTGTWQATAEALDGSLTVGPTPIEISHFNPVFSVMYSVGDVVFYPQPTTFTTGDVLMMSGSGYAPNTAVIVALYVQDPTQVAVNGAPMLNPAFATTVTTDAGGSWSAHFQVGAESPRGDYQGVVFTQDLTAAPITLNPFMARFSIQ
jgi:hypothetical protein